MVLVTGSGTGIGKAMALDFARAGARVVVNARTQADIDATVAEIAAAGGTALGMRADVADPGAVEAMVREVRRALGPVEVLVNNAGIQGPRAFAQEVTPQEFAQVVMVNLVGAFLCSKYVLPSMLEQGWGRIINMTGGGAATEHPLRGGIAYASSKAGVEGFTRNLALEVGRFGVTVNAIQPGRVATRGFPLAGAADAALASVPPEPAARLAVWLASDEAAEVNGKTLSAQDWERERGAAS